MAALGDASQSGAITLSETFLQHCSVIIVAGQKTLFTHVII
jgi:hypothetical protein